MTTLQSWIEGLDFKFIGINVFVQLFSNRTHEMAYLQLQIKSTPGIMQEALPTTTRLKTSKTLIHSRHEFLQLPRGGVALMQEYLSIGLYAKDNPDAAAEFMMSNIEEPNLGHHFIMEDLRTALGPVNTQA